MDHQPFEQWLLSEDSLTEEQNQALESHLETCQDCTRLADAWDVVSVQIRQATPAAPQPGFAERWEARLEARHAAQQRRWTWVALLVFSVGAAGFSLFEVVAKFGRLPTPVELLTGLIYSLTVGAAQAQDTLQFLNAVVKPIPLAVPLIIWIAFSISMLLWVFIWLLGVWRLPKSIRSELS